MSWRNCDSFPPLVKQGRLGQAYANMIWLTRIFLSLLAIYIGLTALAFFAQRKMIYFPADFYAPPPHGLAEVKTADGRLGWHSPARDGLPTVMVFHGNASSIDSNMHIFRDLNAAGYGVWSVGYPGYPGNSGQPTQADLSAAALAQYDALKKRGAENIIFYGTSLGAAVAAQLATERQPDLLIMDAPFNSMSDMARQQMPILPTGLLLKDTWRSDRALQHLKTPLIWIHGTEDRIIPISQGQKLYDGYEGPKTQYIMTGAHHTNTWLMGGREIVLDALSKL